MKKRTIAIILVLALLVQFLPADVLATELVADVPSLDTSEVSASEKSVLGELPERRSVSEKHFRLNDGSYVAVDYGAPIHFSADGGETWKDIDNTLTRSRDDEMLYTAQNGESVRSFSADLREGRLFAASDGRFGIQMGLSEDEGMRFNSASVVEIRYPDRKNRENGELSFDEQITPSKLRTEVLYRDALEGVDLSYELYGYDVKETILVNKPRDSYSFSFDLALDRLVPRQMEDGSIELQDADGEAIYLIPAPDMTDAAEGFSSAVSYDLEKTADGIWRLTITADAKWINAEERVFPVAIDPTVILYPSSDDDSILTSYVNSGRPTSASFNNTVYLRSGYYTNTEYDSDCTGHTVGLIYFKTLPKVPDNCAITDAQLGLTEVKYGGMGNANYHKLYATTIPTPSNPKTYLRDMTWNSYQANIENQYASLGDGNTPTALEYQREINHAATETRYVITNAVQMWYDQNNTSISRLLVLDDGHTSTTNARVTYGGYAYGTAYAPKVYVTYRNTVGIEGIYGYHTQNIGRAGTGYVNDFTLYTTLSVPIISAPSNTLPFGISLIYNEALSDLHFSADTTNPYSGDSNLHTLIYTNAKTGLGWKTSVQQTVKYAFYYVDNAYLQYLVYTDADGTEHCFNAVNSGTVYKDEDGLGLTITTYDTNLYTMKDKEGNTWEFTWGYLTRYADSNGNQLFYAYDGVNYAAGSSAWKPANNTATHRVTGVWRKNDGGELQKVATLTYSGDYLNSITDAANRTTTLGYDGQENLTSLTFPDGKTVSYSYSPYTNADGKTFHRLATACDQEASYRIKYTYPQNQLQAERYTEQTLSGGSWVSGQRVNCFKVNETYSRFRYFDAGSSGNGTCVTLHYFDSWGRTVNVVTMNPEETEVLGVSTGAYTENEAESSKNNRLTNAASAGIQSMNQLKNGGMEHATDLYAWTKDSTGGNAASRENSGTTVLVTPYSGKYLMKLFESNTTAGEYTVQQPVYLEANATYVYSAYVNTACATSFGTNGGAYLTILRNGTEQARSRVLDYKTNTDIDRGWERLEISFTPQVSGTYAVAANINNLAQVAAFDHFQLEKLNALLVSGQDGPGAPVGTASAYNLIHAGSFEFVNTSTGARENATIKQWWTYDSNQEIRVNQTNPRSGSYGLAFKQPRVDAKYRAYQTVPIYGSSNKTYLLSGWGWTPQTNYNCSKTMEGDNTEECRFFGLIAEVSYVEASVDPDYFYVPFSGNINQWQFASGVIVPKQENKTISTITVYACLDYCVNPAYMDDISLLEEPVQTYTYDDKGNLTKTTNSEGKTEITLDSADRMTNYTAINGVSYELSYTGDNRNPDWVQSDGVKNSYVYEASGSIQQTQTTATGTTDYLQSSATYDSTKNFTATATDVNGVETSYTYNTATGMQQSVTTPLATRNYSYYANTNRIKYVYQSGVANLSYLYTDKGELQYLARKTYSGTGSSAVTTWQTYGFAYNNWGQTTQISVSKKTGSSWSEPTAPHTLASYTYHPSGTMDTMTYANGDYVKYEYDALDRLVHESYYNSQNILQSSICYIYNSDGILAKQFAPKIVNGQETSEITTSYTFIYDSLGRLIRSREEDGNDLVQQTEHLYDTANRLTKQSWQIGSTAFTESYAYDEDDGSLASMMAATGDVIACNYDALKRGTGVIVHSGGANGATIYQTAQSYWAVSGSRTSLRPKYYNVKNASAAILAGWLYTYDSNGNICKIQESVSPRRVLAEYEYDALNQLIAETRYTYSDPATTVSCTFGYDTAGNLRTVTDETGTHTYTYTDPSWADLLTSYDGHSITYDATGNPSNWYNGTTYTGLVWQKGRQLASLQVGSNSVSYTYDVTGIRSSKTVGSTVHRYVTQSGRVVRETYGARVLDFIYGADGRPFAVKYSADSGATFTTYYYVLNVQGDVMGLLNSNGTLIVKYTYDAWGRVLSVTNANGTPLTSSANIANINPLRYRSYYYDTETGFYYLQSRYYDPIVKRFLNADGYASTGQGFLGHNMFVYCCNNPAFAADHEGLSAQSIEIDDWGSEGCWSGMSDEEAGYLFDCCYTKTYGMPFTCPSGHSITVRYYTDERTWLERKADVVALALIGLGIGQIIPVVRESMWASCTFTAVTAVVSDEIVGDTYEKGMFFVEEWGIYNGKNGLERRQIISEYEVDNYGILTRVSRTKVLVIPYETYNSWMYSFMRGHPLRDRWK